LINNYIGPVGKEIVVKRVNNRTSQASHRYAPFNYQEVKTEWVYYGSGLRTNSSYNLQKIPSDFYYSKEDGEIIYGSLMMLHYKQYPTSKVFTYVSDFLQDLYRLYQDSCKMKPQTKDDKTLYLAIAKFLTKIYSTKLAKEQDQSTIQYVFILPSREYTEKKFVETFLRPFLKNTPWIKTNDSKSKTLFYNRVESTVYHLNATKLWVNLKKEKKYILFNIKKDFNENKLLLTLDIIRLVYDPDLVAASGRSLTALGENTIISPKFLCPTAIFEIPIPSSIEKMNSLARFLFNKVFVNSKDDKYHALLDDYNIDNYSQSTIHSLIHSIITSNFRVVLVLYQSQKC
jgi:hypothetical protein